MGEQLADLYRRCDSSAVEDPLFGRKVLVHWRIEIEKSELSQPQDKRGSQEFRDRRRPEHGGVSDPFATRKVGEAHPTGEENPISVECGQGEAMDLTPTKAGVDGRFNEIGERFHSCTLESYSGTGTDLCLH